MIDKLKTKLLMNAALAVLLILAAALALVIAAVRKGRDLA